MTRRLFLLPFEPSYAHSYSYFSFCKSSRGRERERLSHPLNSFSTPTPLMHLCPFTTLSSLSSSHQQHTRHKEPLNILQLLLLLVVLVVAVVVLTVLLLQQPLQLPRQDSSSNFTLTNQRGTLNYNIEIRPLTTKSSIVTVQ